MPSDEKDEARWWESAKDHRFALQMLERALVIQQMEGGWRTTTTGLLYLKNLEERH